MSKLKFKLFCLLVVMLFPSLVTQAMTPEDFFTASPGVTIQVTNDENYPWEVNDAGDLVSTMHADSRNTIITFTNMSSYAVAASFDWKVSSENGYDFIGYSTDGSNYTEISGTTDYVSVAISIPANSALYLKYRKDSGKSIGSDCGFIRNLSFLSYIDSNGSSWGYTINDTGAKIISYGGSDSTLVVPSTIEVDDHSYPVVSIGDNVFRDNKKLASVTIPNSVTSIGSSTFYGCSGLTSVTFPTSVTSIGSYAFEFCSRLTSVTIGSSVTSIGSDTFYGCSNMKKVYNLSNLSISKGSYKYGYVGYYANVIYKGLSPELNDEFEFVTVDGQNILSGYVGNSSYLTLPKDYKGEPYVIGSSAFYGCSELISVTIPSSVTSIPEYTFQNCQLHSLTIGTGVTSIGSNAFNNHPTKTIWFTNTPPSGYSQVAGTVNYVSNDNYSSLSNVKKYPYLSSMFEVGGVKYAIVSPSERTCDAIDCAYDGTTDINIDEKVTYKGVSLTVNSINDYAFYRNKNIRSADLSFTGSIGAYAFFDCSSLEDIIIPNSVTSLGRSCFRDCTALNHAKIGNNIIQLPLEAFRNCRLTVVEIGTSVQSIGDCAFLDCSSLPSIAIPANVTAIGNDVFNGCTKLANVVIQDRTTALSLGYSATTGKNLFKDCPLESVYLGGKITYNTSSSYGYSPFYRNLTLKSVEIADEEDTIYDNEFYGCTGLQNVKIGDGVTSIGKYAFSGCSKLESFSFGSSLKTIGQEAFSDCSAMTEIATKADVPPTCGAQALEDINKWECMLYVPTASVDAYQNADQWKDFFFISNNIGHFPEDDVLASLTLEDGTAFDNFIEKDVKTLVYTRNFKNTNWQPLYVPFSMEYSDWASQGLEVARLNGFYEYDDNHDGTVDRSALEILIATENDGFLKPNHPYMVRANSTGVKTITLTDATLYPAVENKGECSTFETKYIFKGTYSPITKEALEAKGAYIMSGGSLKPSSSVLNPMRWYMTRQDLGGQMLPKLTEIKVFVHGEDDATTLDFVNADTEDGTAYNLMGQRIAPTQKGLIIRNGKKVLVK